jgi:hypothetical protein
MYLQNFVAGKPKKASKLLPNTVTLAIPLESNTVKFT